MLLHGPQSQRFTLDGSPMLERHLEAVCAEVNIAVCELIPETQLEGLLLAGGYGRGEGGVLRTASGDQPYNDLEFYVFVRGHRLRAEWTYGAALHELGVRLSARAGVEVEFKVLTLPALRAARPSMFYYDLVLGHRWLTGDDALLVGCSHHRDAREIPLHEATRLLMNRCSGLLFSAERLRRPRFGTEESDFVGRNLAKIQLALGDVLVTASGQYHWSCQERHRCLRCLRTFGAAAWHEAVCRHHGAGLAFKLHPVRSREPREKLARQHAELSQLARQLWLWFENLRLGRAYLGTREYALSATDKCPETSPLRNRLVNAKAFGAREALRGSGRRYPRQRLLHALCLLLWEEGLAENPALLESVRCQLRAPAADWGGLVAAYERLWHRFN